MRRLHKVGLSSSKSVMSQNFTSLLNVKWNDNIELIKNTDGHEFSIATRSLKIYEIWSSALGTNFETISVSVRHRGYNILQNIWRKIKKSSKIRQEWKAFTFCLRIFWAPVSKTYFGRVGWTLASVPMMFWDFPNIFYFSKLFIKTKP